MQMNSKSPRSAQRFLCWDWQVWWVLHSSHHFHSLFERLCLAGVFWIPSTHKFTFCSDWSRTGGTVKSGCDRQSRFSSFGIEACKSPRCQWCCASRFCKSLEAHDYWNQGLALRSLQAFSDFFWGQPMHWASTSMLTKKMRGFSSALWKPQQAIHFLLWHSFEFVVQSF